VAKLFASEAAMEIALDAVRIHGGYEIQRNVIAGQLVARGGI
jgi:butyryl-CoA dehydrogenase